MWWFLRKSQPAALPVRSPVRVNEREQAKQGLLDVIPDMSRLEDHNVAIKIWLPDQVAQTMKWLADYEGVSQSNWVRAQMICYVYGRVAVMVQQIRTEQNRIMFSRGPVDRGAGRWVYLVPQLGKNTVAFKVWVSWQMRDDLLVLASHAGIGLSPFVREALVGALLGRGSLPERPAIMGQPSVAALAWEGDETVEVAQIEEVEFDGLGEAEMLWIADIGADKFK